MPEKDAGGGRETGNLFGVGAAPTSQPIREGGPGTRLLALLPPPSYDFFPWPTRCFCSAVCTPISSSPCAQINFSTGK